MPNWAASLVCILCADEPQQQASQPHALGNVFLMRWMHLACTSQQSLSSGYHMLGSLGDLKVLCSLGTSDPNSPSLEVIFATS